MTDDKLMDLRGAFVGEDRLQIVGMPDNRILQGDAAGPEKGTALTRDGDGLADIVQLP